MPQRQAADPLDVDPFRFGRGGAKGIFVYSGTILTVLHLASAKTYFLKENKVGYGCIKTNKCKCYN